METQFRDNRAMILWIVAGAWIAALAVAVIAVLLWRPDHVPLWGPLVLLVFPAIPGFMLADKASRTPCVEAKAIGPDGLRIAWRLPFRRWEATFSAVAIRGAKVEQVRDDDGSVNWILRVKDAGGQVVELYAGGNPERGKAALERFKGAATRLGVA